MKVLDIKGAIIPNDDKWIYDWLGYESTCPKDVINFIRNLNGKEDLLIEINSGGGDVFAASEMYSAIISYPGKVITRCVGLAGSAASVLLTATQNEIAPTGMVMIHNTQGGARGDYHDLDKGSEILQKANKMILSAYKLKTNMEDDKLFELMDAETWMTAEEAVEYGFCDSIMQNQNAEEIVRRPVVLNSVGMIEQATIEKIRNTVKKTDIENNVPNNPTNMDEEEHFLYLQSMKEGKEMQKSQSNKETNNITTVDELKNAYPELVAQIVDEASVIAISNEHERLKAIEEIAASLPEDTVLQAKYENPVSAAELALQAIKASKENGAKIFNKMVENLNNSGANDVTAVPNAGIQNNAAEKKAESESKIKNLATLLGRR